MKIPLLYVAILLIISCKKNDAPPIETEAPLPIAKLKKVSFWYGFSDTLGLPNIIDTIYYNTNNQIERVQSTSPYSNNSTTNYNITYNSEGKISFIVNRLNDTSTAAYTFIYNTAGKLDSIKSDMHLYSCNTSFKYNVNGDLSDIYSYSYETSQPGTIYMKSHSIYGWNANGKLDSIHIESSSPQIPVNIRTFTFTSASNIMTSLDKTYLLISALVQDPLFDFSTNSGNAGILAFYQFLNPGINMLGEGMEIWDFPESKQHSNTRYFHRFDLYTNKQLRTLIPYYFAPAIQGAYPTSVQRFEYLPKSS